MTDHPKPCPHGRNFCLECHDTKPQPSAEIERLRSELTAERLRADAAVGDANEAEQKLADAKALLRYSNDVMGSPLNKEIDAHILAVEDFLSATAQPAEVKS